MSDHPSEDYGPDDFESPVLAGHRLRVYCLERASLALSNSNTTRPEDVMGLAREMYDWSQQTPEEIAEEAGMSSSVPPGTTAH